MIHALACDRHLLHVRAKSDIANKISAIHHPASERVLPVTNPRDFRLH
jgi:hypothetical protein